MKISENNAFRTAMQLAVVVGLLLVVAGTAMPLFRGVTGIFKYIYAAGAVMVLVGHIFLPYKGDNLRLKRLYRIEAWSGVLFCFGAFFMFYHKYGVGPMDWVAFTLAGGLIRIYASFMIPRASKNQ